MTDSFRDHGLFLRNNSRYSPAFQHSDDGVEFARAVAAVGYATAPNYLYQLVNLINDQNLLQYDQTGDTGDTDTGDTDTGDTDTGDTGDTQ